MTSGFSVARFKTESGDGHNFTLLEAVIYTAANGDQITLPAGATSDGASSPKFAWAELPPFGAYWRAAFLHDFLYRCTDLEKPRCDALFKEAMQACGVEDEIVDTLYEAVHVFGEAAFLADRREAEANGYRLATEAWFKAA